MFLTKLCSPTNTANLEIFYLITITVFIRIITSRFYSSKSCSPTISYLGQASPFDKQEVKLHSSSHLMGL